MAMKAYRVPCTVQYMSTCSTNSCRLAVRVGR